LSTPPNKIPGYATAPKLTLLLRNSKLKTQGKSSEVKRYSRVAQKIICTVHSSILSDEMDSEIFKA
jgi:hypothetical protein